VLRTHINEFVAKVAVGIARFMTRGSGDLEEIYDSIARLSFSWVILMKVVLLLKIDRVILAPAKSKLVPMPLYMSSSERSVLEVFKPKAGDIVVDVGTYIGRYTLIGSDYVGDAGLVIGIEASLHNYQITKRNVEINKAKNVVLVWAAASNREGMIKLYHAERPGWYNVVTAHAKYENVPCKTIDNLLQELCVSRVDWLKIDVEGAELSVLEGSRRTLAENERLKLLIEIHPGAPGSDMIIRFLKQLHYKITFLEPCSNIPFHILASKR
jgi:FkbM family methyltransferase